MKNILVLSKEKTWRLSFAKSLKENFKSLELQAHYVSSRSEAISEITQNQFDLFIISESILKKEVEMIFRYISTNENFHVNIFFISKDFEEFGEILKITQFPKIHLFSSPIEFSELSRQIKMTIFPVVQNNNLDKMFNINLEFLKTFVESSKFIFKEFCLLKEINHQKPILLNQKNIKQYALEGYIHLQSDTFNGIFYVCFNKETYLKVIEHVLMEKSAEINESNIDFVAEIVNMIYGQSKIALNQSGHNFKKVIPHFTLTPPKQHTANIVTIVPIDTELGTIDIKIELLPIPISA